MSELPLSPSATPLAPNNPRPGDTFRKFYVPFEGIEEENKLLQDYEVDNLREVFQEICTEFHLFAQVLRNYAEGEEQEEHVYGILSKKLQRLVKQYELVCSSIADWIQVSQEVTPE